MGDGGALIEQAEKVTRGVVKFVDNFVVKVGGRRSGNVTNECSVELLILECRCADALKWMTSMS